MAIATPTADKRGIKRICMNCSTRFYDFNKRPIICPNCETEFTGEIKVKARRARVANDDDEEDVIIAKLPDDDLDADIAVEPTDAEEIVDDETVSLDDVDEDDADTDEDDDTLDADLDLDEEDDLDDDDDDDLDDEDDENK